MFSICISKGEAEGFGMKQVLLWTRKIKSLFMCHLIWQRIYEYACACVREIGRKRRERLRNLWWKQAPDYMWYKCFEYIIGKLLIVFYSFKSLTQKKHIFMVYMGTFKLSIYVENLPKLFLVSHLFLENKSL